MSIHSSHSSSKSDNFQKTCQTLSDWIREKKNDLRPEIRIAGFKVQAEQSIENDNFEDAIVFYSKAIQLSPNEFSLYSYRSFCYEKTNEFEMCLSDAQKAIDLMALSKPTNITHKDKHQNDSRYRNKLVFYRKGHALKALSRFQEAIDALVVAKSLAIRCHFIDDEIKDIKMKIITDLGYDKLDIESICDKFDSIDGLIKELNEQKRRMITESEESKDVAIIPTNPFKYRGLYVNGLVASLDESQLSSLLSNCGEIIRCKVYSSGVQSRAIITFEDEQSVREAIKTIRVSKDVIRSENHLVIRYRHTCVEGGSDPQINFKGTLIGGECYRWRTQGCDDKDCKGLHIPICHHLDQQTIETESVQRKRTPIKFDIKDDNEINGEILMSPKANSSGRQTQGCDDKGSKETESIRPKRTPIMFDIKDDNEINDSILMTLNSSRRRTHGYDDKAYTGLRTPISHRLGQPIIETESVQRKRTPIKIDIKDNNETNDSILMSPTADSSCTKRVKLNTSVCDVRDRALTSYGDLFD